MRHIGLRLSRIGPRASALLVVLVALSLAAGQGQAQAVGYSIAPTASSVRWDESLALDTDIFYGVRLGILLGSRVELLPFYLRRKGLGLDSSNAPTVHGFDAAGRSVDVRHVGANIQFNLGGESLYPFLRVGGGVIRFDPDSGDRRERVAVSGAAGLRFALGGLQAELFAEQTAYRLTPSRLFATGPADPLVESEEQRNVVYGAALSIPLSSAREGRDGDTFASTTSPVEPFVGRLRYSGDVGLPEQELAGVRAGVDFSPLVGVRGFWWRGVNDDRDGTVPVSGYGGEAQFNLSASTGVTPFVVAGAGRLHYGDSFRDPDGERRDDQSALILGGGVSLVLSDNVRLNVSARDYVFTLDRPLSDAAEVGDLMHNTLVSAGFTLSFGPRQGERRSPAPEAAVTPADEAGRIELERLRAENARLLAERTRQRGDTGITRVRVDTVSIRDTTGVGATGRTITVPVPERGEIILRYGMTPDSARAQAELANMESIRRVIREQLGADTALLRTTGERLDSAAFELRLRLLEERILSRVNDLVEAQVRAPQAQPPVVVVAPTSETGPGAYVSRPFLSRLANVRANDIRPRLGLQTVSDLQVVFSARADLGPVSPSSDLRLVPEVALGIGEGSATLLALSNVQYAPFTVGAETSFQPYVMAGIGLYSRTLLAVNTAIGASLDVRTGRAVPLYAFVELQGINLFDDTRLMFGLSTRR